MTRLRVKVKNPVNIDKLRKVDGVIEVIDADTIQIVLGPKLVKEVKSEFDSLMNNKINIFQRIANIFVPLLPGIIAISFILAINNNIYLEKIARNTYILLPIFVAMSAAKEFGGSYILAGIVGTQLINSPIISALLIGIICACIEKSIRKIVPKILDNFLTPFLTLVLTTIIAVYIIDIIGNFITILIYMIIEFLFYKIKILGPFLISLCFLPLVSKGLHHILLPIHIMLLDPNGPTNGVNYLLPLLIVTGASQIGVSLKMRNTKNLKEAFLGIAEPLMYSIILPSKRAFVSAIIASGITGIFVSIFHIGTYSLGLSGILGTIIVVKSKRVYFLFSLLLAIVLGYILACIFSVKGENHES